jgi:hypothetical protein
VAGEGCRRTTCLRGSRKDLWIYVLKFELRCDVLALLSFPGFHEESGKIWKAFMCMQCSKRTL